MENKLNQERAATMARTAKDKNKLLEQLKQMPIILVASKKSLVGRATYYRWRNEDAEFAARADEAISEGEAFITDMSESQLVLMIKEGNLAAIQLWLKHHHPKYAQKVELSGSTEVSIYNIVKGDATINQEHNRHDVS